ncbi:MAG: ATP-binding cassette domain-containing protein [Actinobacteria bacterium]|nr:ATP-binding cassette domain-containing protein [Actinomycetota bacterium]
MSEVRLLVIQGVDAGALFEVSGTVVVGRDASADFVLDDSQVSRRHLQFHVEDGRAFVEDLGSANGTFVNSALLADRQRLQHGDRIQVGNTLLELVVPALQTVIRREHTIAVAEENSIVVQGLVCEFGGGFRAVDGIDLVVYPGEIYGFLGPNGAGKSTTVHMLTTLLPPSEGTALVAGYDVATQAAKVRSRIGVALQEAALDPLLDAHEHMRLQCAMQGLPKSEWRERSAELIERVGLTEFASGRVGEYSGGMKRRLDLALALVHRPEVIFLDEPTTGLDPKSRADLWEEVARLANEEGVTVFLTTQYLEEADVLARRIAIIDRGMLVAEGTPAELKAEIGRPTAEIIPQDPADRSRVAAILARFGEPAVSAQGAAVRLAGGAEVLADVIRALDAERIRLSNVALHAPTLDDVFLAKTGRSLEEQVGREGGNTMEIARSELIPAVEPASR